MQLSLDTVRTLYQSDKKQIETRLSAEDIYDAANKEQLTELLQRQGAVAAQLEATEMAWLEASETLQTLQQSQ